MLTEADDGKACDLRIGDTVRIFLAENASTGFRWAVDGNDARLLEPGPSDAIYPADTPGSGGRVAFDFTAKARGDAELTMKYWRHWEGDPSVIKHFRIRVHVA